MLPHRFVSLVSVLVLVILIAGCAQTRQSRAVEQSGFLGDYSQLRKGGKNEALYLHIDESADFASYDKIQIVSVEMRGTEDLAKVSMEERKALCGYLYAALKRELGKEMRVVEKPGPGVLQLRAAITEADGARVGLNTVTTIVPQARMLSTLSGMVADTAVLVGQASLEVEIKDSATQKRVAAGLDRRVGAKSLRNAFSKWADVESAYDHWAERIATRLGELRQGG